MAPNNSFRLLSYIASPINSPHITITVGTDKIQGKKGAMVDSFGANSQTEQKRTVPMPNPVICEDTNISLTSKLHSLCPDHKFPQIGIF
jgi:hypothetical protein